MRLNSEYGLRLLLACYTLLFFEPLYAVTFTVDTADDRVDAIPGNGACNFNIPGDCSLRAAIMEANALPGVDVIEFEDGLNIVLDRIGNSEDLSVTGDLDITESLTIRYIGNQPPIIDANLIDRVFHVHSTAASVIFFGLSITGGLAIVPGTTSGGGIYIEPNAQTVSISFCNIFGNIANVGGGVYSEGETTILASSIFFNGLTDNVIAPQFINGTGIHNRGEMRIENSSIQINGLGIGTVSNRFAISSVPTFTESPSLIIINSTIGENQGGALRSQEGSLSLNNVTIAYQSGVGISFSPSGSTDNQLRLRNTVISDNSPNCSFGGNEDDWTIDNYNADSDGSCELEPGSTNLPNTFTRLAPTAALNGGFNFSYLPLPGSELIDNGHPASGIVIGCSGEDQRFMDRPEDGDNNGLSRCDIGAIEFRSEDLPEEIFIDNFE